MNTANPNTVLLIAPVVDGLLDKLSTAFQVYRLYEQADPQAFLRDVGHQVQAVVTRGDIGVTRAVLEQLPNAGLVAVFGVGTDAVDLDYTRAHDIAVTITSGVLTNDVADLAMGLLLAGARQLCLGDKFVREGKWLKQGPGLATQVSGKRIGIFGMGNIGQAIARRASGFDMEILYTDRKKLDHVDYQWCADLHTLAHESDFLVIAASGGAANRGLIDASVFNVMPKHAWLINIARGTLVDEQAVVDALRSGKLAGFAADVVSVEPMQPDNPLLQAKGQNIIVTPHIAWATHEARERLLATVTANVGAFVEGAPQNVVN